MSKGKKLIVTCIISIGMVFALAAPVYALDNITAIDLTLSDNVTFIGGTANVSIDGLITALTDATTNMTAASSDHATALVTAFNAAAASAVYLFLLGGLLAVSFWQWRKWPLRTLSGLGLVVYGFGYWTTQWTMSILLVIAGLYIAGDSFTDKGKKE